MKKKGVLRVINFIIVHQQHYFYFYYIPIADHFKSMKEKKSILSRWYSDMLSPISGFADITDIRIPAWAPLSTIRFISLLQTTCSQLVTILLKNITKKNKNLSSNFLLGIWRHKFKVGQEKLLVHTLRFVMCHQIAVENVIWYATKFKQSISI